MSFMPGDIVVLKSGGQPMTVVAAGDQGIECIWMGESGALLRETIPAIALLNAADLDDDEEDEDDEDDE